jgi:hypothetical protein
VGFLEDDEQIMMIRNENGEHLFTKRMPKKSQAKQTTLLVLRTVTVLKILKLKIDTLECRLTILCPHGQVDKPSSQNV